MNHCMVDLETLDNRSTALILSIGAVKMDLVTCELGPEFYVRIDAEDAQRRGLTIGADTVMWWLKQPAEAQAALFGNSPLALDSALRGLTRFITDGCGVEAPVLWGNGATFDNVILRHAYESCNFEYPVKYYDDLCYRTVKNMFPIETPLRPGVKHNALDDARYQATVLVTTVRKLREMEPITKAAWTGKPGGLVF